MKKLSMFLSVFTIFCFLTAGNSYAADPQCGVFIESLGTSYNTLSPAFTTIPGMCQDAMGTCPGWDGGISWSLHTCPGSCEQFTATLPMVVTTVNPNHGPAIQALKLQMKYRQENPNGFGTFTFMDWRNQMPPNPIPRWHCKIVKSNADVGLFFSSYVSAQTGVCDVDFAAYPLTSFPVESEFMSEIECEIVSGTIGATTLAPPPEYTRVKFRYYGNSGVGAPTPVGTIGYKIAAPVRQTIVEISKPLRGDLDGNSVMTGADYSIFAADWATGTALCACPTYWP